MNKRIHVIVSGRVQGVCFRAFTKRQAVSLGLKGWVRNLTSGDVEAVFEGDEDLIQAMLAWCRKGPPLAKVTSIDAREEPVSGTFTNFQIRY